MKTTYDLINIFQNKSFDKYGSYSHAAGWLGSVLDDALHRLPKKDQEHFKERLQQAIFEALQK